MHASASERAPTFWECIKRPKEAILLVDQQAAAGALAPWSAWTPMVFIAFLGSALFGASAVAGLRQFSSVQDGATWLIVSAGLAWVIFGPLLVLISRRRIRTCAHACLVTMTYGEFVLFAGAIVNVLFQVVLYFTRIDSPLHAWPVYVSFAIVGISNIVMASILTIQMEALGVPGWKTLLAWFLFLDGIGAGLFYAFYLMLAK